MNTTYRLFIAVHLVQGDVDQEKMATLGLPDLVVASGGMGMWDLINKVFHKLIPEGAGRAGTGFGMRDMDFDFDDEIKARAYYASSVQTMKGLEWTGQIRLIREVRSLRDPEPEIVEMLSWSADPVM